MHLRKLQAVLGLGGPCQSSSQGRRADRADGVVHLQSGGRLVSQVGTSVATFSLPTLVSEEGRAIVCRHVDDPEAGQLRGKNATTASRTVWPENLDRPTHRASQPNRVSDTSAEDPASSTSSRSIRRGEFHPPGRSRTTSKFTKQELSIRGKVGELAELQLLPGIGKEPLGAVFARRIEAAPSFLRIIRGRFDDVKRTFPWFEIETHGQLRSRIRPGAQVLARV